MSDFTFSFENFDDSSGEALGDGLDSSALTLTGDTESLEFDDTLQGSSLDLAGSGADTRVFDGESLSLDDQYDLSGSTEAAPSEFADTGNGDTNGAGSADTVHPANVSTSNPLSTIFSGVSKFGASIGQLFAAGGAQTQPRVMTPSPYLNPNRSTVAGISAAHAALVVGAIILVGAVIVSGGKNV